MELKGNTRTRLHHLLFAAALGVSALPAVVCRMTMPLEQWPQYLYRDGQGRYTGLDLALLKAIFKKARCTELPTARRQLLLGDVPAVRHEAP